MSHEKELELKVAKLQRDAAMYEAAAALLSLLKSMGLKLPKNSLYKEIERESIHQTEGKQ